MDYTLMPSLEHRVMVKIIVTLWSQDDTDSLSEYCAPSLQDTCKIVEDKVSKLSLPELLKEKVSGFVKPIGKQIMHWKEWFNYFFRKYSVKHEVSKFRWTPYGTLDRRKTAEVLVKDQNLNVDLRYNLACTFCLESDISILWNQNGNEKVCLKYLKTNDFKRRLLSFWTRYMARESPEGDFWWNEWRERDPYVIAFEYSTYFGNVDATRYFLQKLNSDQKEMILLQHAMNVADTRFSAQQKLYFFWYFSDVLCLLLSAMNEEQQVQVFRNHACGVLNSLMDWPRQEFFIPTAQLVWAFISAYDFYSLLFKIAVNIMYDHKGYNYKVLFGKFWQDSPTTLKSYITQERAGKLLTWLFQAGDKENISMILKDKTANAKEQIIFTSSGMEICISLACTDNWDLLKFFTSECILSKEAMMKFKEELQLRRWIRCKFVAPEVQEKRMKTLLDYLTDIQINEMNGENK